MVAGILADHAARKRGLARPLLPQALFTGILKFATFRVPAAAPVAAHVAYEESEKPPPAKVVELAQAVSADLSYKTHDEEEGHGHCADIPGRKQ